MSIIKLSSSGNFKHCNKLLKTASTINFRPLLEAYGKKGVEALSKATPIDTGKTSKSWGYKITEDKSKITITWTNDNVVDGVPIAIIIQYGHATGNGGWVEGRDYINPAIQPVFDEILKNVWEEVTK